MAHFNCSFNTHVSSKTHFKYSFNKNRSSTDSTHAFQLQFLHTQTKQFQQKKNPHQMEIMDDGRLKVGTQQTSSKMIKDVPPIGPFPPILLSKVPKDSPLLTDVGCVLPIEIGYYTFNDDFKITKIEYKGELDMDWEGRNFLF